MRCGPPPRLARETSSWTNSDVAPGRAERDAAPSNKSTGEPIKRETKRKRRGGLDRSNATAPTKDPTTVDGRLDESRALEISPYDPSDANRESPQRAELAERPQTAG